MMHIKICRSDGGVSIMDTSAATPEAIEAEVRKWAKGSAMSAVSYEAVADQDIPQDRTFRGAWAHDLSVDMPKARDIHMARIRVARDQELARLDIEQLKGVDVTAEKEVLRDLPATFDLTIASTPDELKALWPAEIPRKA